MAPHAALLLTIALLLALIVNSAFLISSSEAARPLATNGNKRATDEAERMAVAEFLDFVVLCGITGVIPTTVIASAGLCSYVMYRDYVALRPLMLDVDGTPISATCMLEQVAPLYAQIVISCVLGALSTCLLVACLVRYLRARCTASRTATDEALMQGSDEHDDLQDDGMVTISLAD